ncbi:MAG: hypothetical protein KC636_38575, partial [Myxococcales bacterium]|nr:hypothetical protein [Myxococcales bacterium]
MLRSLRILTLTGLVLAVSACGGKQKGNSNAPGGGGGGDDRTTRLNDARNETLIGLANEDLAVGKHAKARQRAEDALAIDKNNPDAYAVIGAADFRAGNFESSSNAYREALEIKPDHYGALIGLAGNLQAEGKHDEALVMAEKAGSDATQMWPKVRQLSSLYALADFDKAQPVVDAIFKFEVEKTILPVIQLKQTFVNAFAGKGPMIQVEGAKGSSDLQIDTATGFKHIGAAVGGEFKRAILFEVREEARVDAGLAKQLKLPSLGKVKLVGQEAELDLVLIPEIKIGEMTIKNIPAIAEDLSAYAGIGEVPGLVLGRQFMQRFGAITFNFPEGSSEFVVAPPAAKPNGSFEAPFILIDALTVLIPVTKTQLDDSDHAFYTWFGGVFLASSTSVSRRAYLKSGHLPRELEELD